MRIRRGGKKGQAIYCDGTKIYLPETKVIAGNKIDVPETGEAQPPRGKHLTKKRKNESVQEKWERKKKVQD